MKLFFVIVQYLVPQHLLSRLIGKLADCETLWFKNAFIDWFIKRYRVNMSEAADPEYRNYPNFNAFFTRALKDGARPIVEGDNTIALPADGAISQLGDIENGRIFQAKGHHFSLTELLGGDVDMAEPFQNGKFATVYLSPKDYHRVHMPLTGTLKSMTYVPGDLFSVGDITADNVPNLFARNERAVCMFETERGPMAVVLVGAMIVAGIETVWSGQITPVKREVRTTHYPQQNETLTLEKGAELGRFKLGSTAIVLFPENTVEWDEALEAGSPTLMGELMGTLL